MNRNLLPPMQDETPSVIDDAKLVQEKPLDGSLHSACSPVCPRCGRPRTNEGQPSRRWFYACGSYLYEGEKLLRDRTDICEAVEALNDAAELLAEIMRDEVNHQDEAEKWLRAYAPQYLANDEMRPWARKDYENTIQQRRPWRSSPSSCSAVAGRGQRAKAAGVTYMTAFGQTNNRVVMALSENAEVSQP